MVHQLAAGGGAIVRGGQAAYYRGNGPAVLVYAASLTSAGASNVASVGYAPLAKASVTASGGKDPQSFPAGPHGGALYCGHGGINGGGTAIFCGWVDHTAFGVASYHGGSAASLADAASKTRQIRAAIEP